MQRILISAALLVLSTGLYSQGIQDSLFRIKAVRVVAERIFEMESAGMTETIVDSTILSRKVKL